MKTVIDPRIFATLFIGLVLWNGMTLFVCFGILMFKYRRKRPVFSFHLVCHTNDGFAVAFPIVVVFCCYAQIAKKTVVSRVNRIQTFSALETTKRRVSIITLKMRRIVNTYSFWRISERSRLKQYVSSHSCTLLCRCYRYRHWYFWAPTHDWESTSL